MQGDTCEPPKNLAVDASQKRIAGWHDGQSVLVSAFKKKREIADVGIDPDQTDVSERTDLQPTMQ
jgi:hypothetical protein